MISESVRICDVPFAPSQLDVLDSRCRVVCAFLAVMALASVQDIRALAAGSALPAALLLLDGRVRAPRLMRTMLNVNKIGLLVWIFLPLTYPGGPEGRLWGIVSPDGVMAALVITWKLNIMSVVMIQMVASMGVPGISDALGRLGCPLKLRMLILLTTRYIFLLSDRVATMCRAVRLRSGDAGGLGACRIFACMVGTTLVHSADRAGRASLAMSCRGGEEGFAQRSGSRWALLDSLVCAAFLLDSALVIFVSFLSSAQPFLR